MDGISFLDAIVVFTMLLSPLISIVLLLFWISTNMKNTAKIQLLGIVILLVLGFLAINSSLISVIHAVVMILLLFWIFVHRKSFLKEQLPVILALFALQIGYYMLFVPFIAMHNLAIALLCLIPILSMILLYPWTFGNKKKTKGRVFIISLFVVQFIFLISNFSFLLIAMPNI